MSENCAHGFITPDVCPVCQMMERVRKAEHIPTILPHAYVPDASHYMGDCAVCGHTQSSPVHI